MKIEKITVFRKDLIPDTSNEEYIYTESLYEPETGLLLNETRYTADGRIEEIANREYDHKGFLTLVELTDGDGITLEKRTFEPDSKGRTDKEFVHYHDGSTDRIENTFDEKGRLVKRVFFDDDDDVEAIEVYEYEGDYVSREAEFDSDEEVVRERLFSHNEVGLLAEEVVIDNEEGQYFKKEFFYNPDGKIEEILVFNKKDEPIERLRYTYNQFGKPETIIEENKSRRTSTNLKYNENGEVVLEEETDHNGNLIRKIERTFNDQGLVSETKVLTRNIAYGITRSYILTSKYSIKKTQ